MSKNKFFWKKNLKTASTHGLAALGGALMGKSSEKNFNDILMHSLGYHYEVINTTLKGMMIISKEYVEIYNKLKSDKFNKDLTTFWNVELVRAKIIGNDIDKLLKQLYSLSSSELRQYVASCVVSNLNFINRDTAESLLNNYPDIRERFVSISKSKEQLEKNIEENLSKYINNLSDENAKKILLERLKQSADVASSKGEKDKVKTFLVSVLAIHKVEDYEKTLISYGNEDDKEFYRSVDFVIKE